MEPITSKVEFWCEWRSWALPLRIGVMGGFCKLEIQIGPFGLTWV